MSSSTQVAAPRRASASIAITPHAALAALVAASVVGRLALVLQRRMQGYLPDEYLYGQLARSIAEGEGFQVLGVPVGTPALLQPLLTAPTWLTGDPVVAFRLTQGINVVAMSLGAVAVFAIARTLSLPPWTAVAAAGVALASPDLLYAGYVTADAIAYSLALLAILAALRALSRPSLRAQGLFLAAAAVATFARLQYASLFVAVAFAAVVVERARPAAVLRRHWLLLAAPLSTGLGVVALGGLGRYANVASFGLSLESLRWVPVSALLLALATAVVVVPGALAWMGAQLARPTSVVRAALAAITVALVSMLLVASALVSSETGSDRFLERYLMLAVPLAVIAFCCWLEESRPLWQVAAALAVIVVVVVARLPVSEHLVGQGTTDSPLLLAVARLQDSLGVGSASLVVALAATACAGLAAATALGHVGARGALLATTLVLLATSLGAHEADHRASLVAAETISDGTPNWVDRSAASGDVLLVEPSAGFPAGAMLTALSNGSITGIALLGSGIDTFDGAVDRLSVDQLGILRLRGEVVVRPLVVDEGSTRIFLANAHPLARVGSFTLVEPPGAARLAAAVAGLYGDGWLAGTATVTLYATGRPGACRHVALRLGLPEGSSPVSLTFAGGGDRRTVQVSPGVPQTVELEGDAARRTVIELTGAPSRWQSEPSIRSVSAQAVLSTTVGPCAADGS